MLASSVFFGITELFVAMLFAQDNCYSLGFSAKTKKNWLVASQSGTAVS